jgi:hypothetical protein
VIITEQPYVIRWGGWLSTLQGCFRHAVKEDLTRTPDSCAKSAALPKYELTAD